MKGSIRTRTLHDARQSKRYDAIWRADGKLRWKTFDRKREAERFLASVVKSVHEGTYRSIRPLPMAELFDRWLADDVEVRVKLRTLKPSTAKGYRSMVRRHLQPAFGAYRSDRFDASAVTTWVAGLADAIASGDLAPKYFNNLLTLLHTILGWARRSAQNYVAHDPLTEQKRLPRSTIEREFLHPPQIDALLEAAGALDQTLITVAVYAGLRRGELFALQWGDVEWGSEAHAGRLWIRRSIYQGAITKPKTATSERKVDIPQRVLDELTIYKAMCPPKDGQFIFRTETGSPLDPDNWYKRRFLPTLERAGLPHVGLHALRHTYASLLINQGESIKYVSQQLGHASITITADLYGHIFRSTSLAAMQRLEERMPAAAREATASNSDLTEHAETAELPGTGWKTGSG